MFDRYRFVVTPNKVIALTSYAGKTVKGIAKCHPNDEFNEEIGKKIAAVRCNQKIAMKKLERSNQNLKRILKEAYNITTEYEMRVQQHNEAWANWEAANKEAEELWNSLC